MKGKFLFLFFYIVAGANFAQADDVDLSPYLRKFRLNTIQMGSCEQEIRGIMIGQRLSLGSFMFPSTSTGSSLIDDDLIRIETTTTVRPGKIVTRTKMLTKPSHTLSDRTETASLNGARLTLTSKSISHTPGEPSYVQYWDSCLYDVDSNQNDDDSLN